MNAALFLYSLKQVMDKTSIFAVVPAYNVQDTIVEVIKGLQVVINVKNIAIVDDGSTDSTVKKVSEIPYVNLIRHATNRGKGAALKSGIKWAAKRGAKYILTMDSDAQHNPLEADSFFSKIKERDYDIVIGSRMKNRSVMPFHRRLSNLLTSKLISIRIKQKVVDSQSGYRLYGPKTLQKIVALKSDNFDFESEILLRAGLTGFKMGFVNIETIYHKNQPSSIRAFDVIRFIKIYFQSLFWKGSNAR